MANLMLRSVCRVSAALHRSISIRQILVKPEPIFTLLRPSQLHQSPHSFRQAVWFWQWRSVSHGSVNVVISQEGKPKFETHEIDPPKKEKWLSKKRLKLLRKREKQRRKAANKKDPRRLGVKGKKKRRFATEEERIKHRLEMARTKEALLIERLKRYEVPKAQGPLVQPHELTGEERFYMKKMAQKRSNYVPVGRRGVFGGVILNMHMHWKKHETVEVICKPCKPGQIQEYADEIARLSGGMPIQVKRNTIIFYRGKNYVQPKVMSPVDTLSKKRALEKSKYEQSLESVRLFIAISEKELELYNRHVALYAETNNKDPKSVDCPRARNGPNQVGAITDSNFSTTGESSKCLSSSAASFVDEELSEYADEESSDNMDYEDDDMLSEEYDDEESSDNMDYEDDDMLSEESLDRKGSFGRPDKLGID